MSIHLLIAGVLAFPIVPAATPAPRTELTVLVPPGRDTDPTGQTFPRPVGVVALAAPDASVEPIQAGLLDRWASAGIDLGFSTILDLSASSARQAGDPRLARGLLDASVGIDFGETFGLEGTSMFAQLLWRRGPNGSSYTGDLHGFSNIDTEPFSGLGELWVQSRLGDRLRLKAGRVDANTEFAGVSVASDFLNSAMGVSPAISHLPTYPDPALSLNAFANLHPRLRLGVGIYGDSSGTGTWSRPFSIAEMGTTWSLGRSLDGTASIGGWEKRGELPGERGAYAVVEQTLWMRSDEAASVASFLQWGHTSESCGVDRHLGGGVVWKGWLPSRSQDALGFGVTRVRTGSRADVPGERELVLASYGRIDLGRGLALIPDLQLIRSPGAGSPSTRLVGTVRMTAGF